MSPDVRSKITYVLPRYDPAIGSHFFHLYELLRHAAGYLDIRVVVERGRGTPAELGTPLYVQRFHFAPLRFLELLVVLFGERMRGRRFFYVHYSLFGGVAAWVITRLAGGRSFYWNCGMPWLYRRAWFEEATLRFVLRSNILVTGTAGLAAEYQRRYGLRSGRVRVLPNWVNVARFRSSEYAYDRKRIRGELDIPLDAKVVLFAHRLSRRKGAHLLPGIISEVTARRKDVIFVIVGAGPERESIESRIKNLELSTYVRLVGEVPHRTIAPYFSAADVFLMPSEEEGFPHVLLEAMASGVPYVASDIGGVREITPPVLSPYLVPSGSVPLFAGMLLDLLAKPPAETAAMAHAEREWVRQYDIHRVLPQFTGLFMTGAESPRLRA